MRELNTRIEQPVTPLQFRPNFVVDGAVAYDEDNWRWVRIGDNLIFKYTGPCLRYTYTYTLFTIGTIYGIPNCRCYVVTMDPKNGVLNKQQEPLKTLKTYRCVETCKSPVMGIYLLLLSSGDIKCGDAVYVGTS